MTKLEELEMKLSKYEALKVNLINKINKLNNGINKYSFECNKLINNIKEIKKSNNISKLLIILPFILYFLIVYGLFNFNGILFEQIIKIIILTIPIMNTYKQAKIINSNRKKLNNLEEEYRYISQDLFAEEFFLKNTKDDILINDEKIDILKEQINNLNYSNNDNSENISSKEKVLIKKL